MKKTLSTTTKALALALAASTFSFAGPGLADGAAKFVGNITTNGQVRSDFGTYWNQITAENECKWGSINTGRGQFNWRGCDAAYNWAKQNGGHFKFHALVWGSQYPSWIKGKSASETKEIITEWFDAVAEHYPDLEMIDVVNEAIRTGNNSYHSGYTETNIIQALGGDNNGDYTFVTTAFKMARDRWPNAILIYNDYNTVQWNVDQGIDLIQKIKKAGAPVDGYGLQAHDMMSQGGGAGGTGGGGSCLAINTLKSTIKKIHDQTQIPLFISEYDIASTDDNVQKQCYSEQISFFMETEYIAGITIWGYIFGNTWLKCGNVGGCSGIIKDGKDRAAMTWLKDYLSKNKGVNTTGLPTGELTQVEPEPQTPFKGEAFAVPGKIEAEDFDIPGKGKNEDGTSNASYSDADSQNHGDSDYRKDTGVDLYKKSGDRIVVGYNEIGDWLEYTINVSEAGDYTFFAAVASANNTSSFQMFLDEKELTDKISVPQASSGEENYDDYNKVSANVTLPAGKHILRMDVTGDWFDIDYFTFVKGKDATDPEPIETQIITNDIQLNQNTLQDYFVFDAHGVNLGVISGYGFDAAAEMLKSSSDIRNSGIYYLRNRTTGKMQSVRIAK
ncbi:MAG: endo-1,4-beta-xylanase [Fibrobacter sp.]|uniref:endo-1,4-beta-xylanase n=1 Tax=Fibrobacter sp. TaxID=35828 RepID=UPI002A90AE14|nr:endo-1,4-beta-xylanase [Fibrobacter sp.]MDY6265017.1 endo-1,4-beta-xylanase [Fibrobacter sp.]